MGLLLLLVIIEQFFSNFPSPTAPFTESWPAWLSFLLEYLVPLAAIIFSQLYRYRRVSTPRERQQTKWIVLGVTAAIGVVIVFLAISVLFPTDVNADELSGQIVS